MMIFEGDILFKYGALSVSELGPADVRQDTNDIEQDHTLETSVLISLFTDARAAKDDKLPSKLSNKAGYWGSSLVGFEVGSKRWLLSRSKLDTNTIQRVKQYDEQSLQWMIDDGILKTVLSEPYRNGPTRLDTKITLSRPQGDFIYFGYYINWQQQTLGGL